MKEKCFLGIDLGGESGRVIAGLWDGNRLRLEEVHRFPNGGVPLGESLRWDVLRLWSEIENGLGLAAMRFGNAIVSVGADTWGVDFVLLSKSGELLGHAELRVVASATQPEAGDFPLARIMHRLKACGLMDAVFPTFLRSTTFQGVARAQSVAQNESNLLSTEKPTWRNWQTR